jgi:hypothetical protein
MPSVLSPWTQRDSIEFLWRAFRSKIDVREDLQFFGASLQSVIFNGLGKTGGRNDVPHTLRASQHQELGTPQDRPEGRKTSRCSLSKSAAKKT